MPERLQLRRLGSDCCLDLGMPEKDLHGSRIETMAVALTLQKRKQILEAPAWSDLMLLEGPAVPVRADQCLELGE